RDGWPYVSKMPTLRLWDTASGVERSCHRAPERDCEGIVYSRRGWGLFWHDDDGNLIVWDSQTGVEHRGLLPGERTVGHDGSAARAESTTSHWEAYRRDWIMVVVDTRIGEPAAWWLVSDQPLQHPNRPMRALRRGQYCEDFALVVL